MASDYNRKKNHWKDYFHAGESHVKWGLGNVLNNDWNL
jgi:hypothetical protein